MILLAATWLVCIGLESVPTAGRQAGQNPRDPEEPLAGKPTPKLLAPPSGAITPGDVDQKTLAAIINELVACGTRSSLSSCEGGTRGIGCR